MNSFTAFFARLGTAIKVSRHASQAMATRMTALVSIVLIPLFDLFFSLLMGASLQADSLVRIGYASTLVGIGITAMSFINQSVVYARWVGIIQDVIQRRGPYPVYWLGISFWAAAAALGMGLVPFLGTFAFDASHSGSLLLTALAAVPLALLVGIALGAFTSAFGLLMSDPYALSNACGFLLPITAGTVVPLGYYPWHLGSVLRFLPLSSLVQALTGRTPLGQALLIELVQAIVWTSFGFLGVRVAVSRLRSGEMKQIL
ncbi:MAG: hypothetical protein ACFNZJ_06000 [Parascardovia denticolens]